MILKINSYKKYVKSVFQREINLKVDKSKFKTLFGLFLLFVLLFVGSENSYSLSSSEETTITDILRTNEDNITTAQITDFIEILEDIENAEDYDDLKNEYDDLLEEQFENYDDDFEDKLDVYENNFDDLVNDFENEIKKIDSDDLISIREDYELIKSELEEYKTYIGLSEYDKMMELIEKQEEIKNKENSQSLLEILTTQNNQNEIISQTSQNLQLSTFDNSKIDAINLKFSNFYTKEEIKNLLENINLDEYVKKSEFQNLYINYDKDTLPILFSIISIILNALLFFVFFGKNYLPLKKEKEELEKYIKNNSKVEENKNMDLNKFVNTQNFDTSQENKDNQINEKTYTLDQLEKQESEKLKNLEDQNKGEEN